MQLISSLFLLQLLLESHLAKAWGNSGSSSYSVDPEVYGHSLTRDWLYDASAISLKLEGCVWGYVEDNEDSGCLEDSSEDGTYYWYQMSNCRRAQAVVSVYATGSGGYASCNSGNFKESVSAVCPSRSPNPGLLVSFSSSLQLHSLTTLSYSSSPRTASENSCTCSPPTTPTQDSAATTDRTTTTTTEEEATDTETFPCANKPMATTSVLVAPPTVPFPSSTLMMPTA